MNEKLTAVEALRRVLFLRGLPAGAFNELAQAGIEVALGPAELLFAEPQRCKGLIVVLSGSVRLYKLDRQGRELTLGVEGPGASVVELPLFDGGNYPMSAEAQEEGTRVLIVPPELFHEICGRYPYISRQVLKAMGVRMRRIIQMLEAQALHSVQQRLAAYLLEAAGERDTFPLTETNDEIAGHVGTVREVVSRGLRALRESGAIELSGRTVRVIDSPRLGRLAGIG